MVCETKMPIYSNGTLRHEKEGGAGLSVYRAKTTQVSASVHPVRMCALFY